MKTPTVFLLPGAYVTVTGEMRERHVAYSRGSPIGRSRSTERGDNVFVVDDENRVQERRIETGAAIDADWVVISGLSAGERVIIQGVQKSKPRPDRKNG